VHHPEGWPETYPKNGGYLGGGNEASGAMGKLEDLNALISRGVGALLAGPGLGDLGGVTGGASLGSLGKESALTTGSPAEIGFGSGGLGDSRRDATRDEAGRASGGKADLKVLLGGGVGAGLAGTRRRDDRRMAGRAVLGGLSKQGAVLGRGPALDAGGDGEDGGGALHQEEGEDGEDKGGGELHGEG
jgi:hypothetical protein